MKTQLLHGDCLERLKELPANSVDAIVTDPPYGLSFMGKKWDYDVPSEDIWRECLRVLRPGGHLLAFAGTRTQHRMAVRIEDAGFEIRDMIAWVYGSGFPKSLDVSKAIDRAAGAEREVLGRNPNSREACNKSNTLYESGTVGKTDFITAPATEAARQWQGFGTSLKPALEPVTVARKPLSGTVAANVLEYGTGALNIDGCRVGTEKIQGGRAGRASGSTFNASIGQSVEPHTGRWPANLIHDGSEEVVELFPQANGSKPGTRYNGPKFDGDVYNASSTAQKEFGYGDSGSAARFFYVAKASKRDRDEGCEGLEARRTTFADGTGLKNNGDGTPRNLQPSNRNYHPTVKPTALMRYLCRLVTPPGGTVLDPFMGSGSTGKAAMLEGFQFIGIERESEYLEIAKARIEHAAKSVDPQLDMPGMV